MTPHNNTKSANSILRELIVLSIPTVIEQIMSTLMQYVDTAMVGRLGEQATAAVSTTTTINWLASCVPFSVATGVLAIIARENGAGNTVRAKHYAGQAVTLALLSGVLLTLLTTLLSPFIPIWMGAAPEIQKAASDYFFLISLTWVFRSADTIFGSAIRAIKNTRTPMIINLSGNVLNVILNYIFIYRCKMGVNGAALGTIIAYAYIGIFMFISMRKSEKLRYNRKDLRLRRESIRAFARIGIPSFGTNAASCLGYVLFTGMVSGMGTTIFAAHSIAVTAEQLFYIPGYGLRTATSSLIGNALGEGDKEKMAVTERLSIVLTIVSMFLFGIILFFTAYPLMKFFTISESVAQLGAEMLRLVAFTEPFFGLMIVLEGIFYGLGETKGIFIVETASMYGIRILFTFFVTKVWMLDLRAVWYCMIADNIMKALLLLALYLMMVRRRKEAHAV